MLLLFDFVFFFLFLLNINLCSYRTIQGQYL
nr:MAG TPA: hypothetical protein [Caudoviricetes sp.]